MKRFRKSALIFMLIACLGMLLVSCNGKETKTTTSDENENVSTDKPKEEAKDTDEKVTLKIMVAWDDNMFNERFKTPIEKKFPNITVEHVEGNNFSREDMEKQFAKGIAPDIFFTLSKQDIEYFKLENDLDPLMEMNNFDTSKINPVLLDIVRSNDDKGRLLSWPYEYTYYVLMYNKDLFDMLGEPYPTDDMTWEDALNLGKKLSVTRDGVQYRGLDFRDIVPLDQFSVTATDPETGEVQITDKPEYKRYLELFDELFNTPGYGDEPFVENMFTDGKTAMLVTNAQALNWYQDRAAFAYDVATVPSWKDLPDTAPRGFLHTLTINPASKHQNEAFKVLSYFASDEYQLWMSQNGVGPITTNTDILNQYYSSYESTHGLNIPSIFKDQPAGPPEKASKWDQFVSIDLKKFKEANVSPNEFLRTVKEESEIKIKDEKNKE